LQLSVLNEKQYKSLSNKLISSLEKKFKIIPLNTLKHPKYSLRKPIFITIETDKNNIIVSLSDIETFAYADTEYEAINLLCNEIVNLYEDLKNDKDSLGILPQKWLNYLEEVICNKIYT
jgi:hypothetical protein